MLIISRLLFFFGFALRHKKWTNAAIPYLPKVLLVSPIMTHSYAHVIQSADEKAAHITEKFADVLTPPPAELRTLKMA